MPEMEKVRFAHDFVCAIRESELVCNTGTEYSRIDRFGSFKGKKMVASNVHKQVIFYPLLEGVDNIYLKMNASVGNIIGCFLSERTGTIRCVEEENTEAGRKRIISEIEMWLPIERGGI